MANPIQLLEYSSIGDDKNAIQIVEGNTEQFCENQASLYSEEWQSMRKRKIVVSPASETKIARVERKRKFWKPDVCMYSIAQLT
jgi:hypothetical protein